MSREKALREGQNVPTNTPAISTAPKKIVDHASARLQIRFGTDKPIIRSWSKSTTMLQVAIDVEPETGCEPDKVHSSIRIGTNMLIVEGDIQDVRTNHSRR